jgi:hypothetical protein
MTARLGSNLSNGQAGDFTAGAQQIVLCDNGDRQGVGLPNAGQTTTEPPTRSS